MASKPKVKYGLSKEAQKLAAAAKAASREAVEKTFAAGLSIMVAKNGKLVMIAPDRTETVVGSL